jgi:hypothetical protein
MWRWLPLKSAINADGSSRSRTDKPANCKPTIQPSVFSSSFSISVCARESPSHLARKRPFPHPKNANQPPESQSIGCWRVTATGAAMVLRVSTKPGAWAVAN